MFVWLVQVCLVDHMTVRRLRPPRRLGRRRWTAAAALEDVHVGVDGVGGAVVDVVHLRQREKVKD